MKQLNIKMVLLSCILTAVVLFGGWFAIQFLNTEKPILDWVEAREGMEIVDIKSDRESLQVEVRFANQSDFGQDVLQFYNYLEDTRPGKQIDILIAAEQGEYHAFWLENASAFLEILNQGHLTQFDAVMQRLKTDDRIDDGRVMMTTEHIFLYFDLADDEEVYIILPAGLNQGGE